MPTPPTPSSSSSTPETTAGLADILRLKMLFATLPDERVAGRVLHPLPEVLLTALCAMVSDCESYTNMESFARSQLNWLRQFIPLRHGPPSHDVFRNVFLALQPELLRELSAKVLKSSPLKGSVRSKRKRCALDPAFRSEVTRPIFHGFGA